MKSRSEKRVILIVLLFLLVICAFSSNVDDEEFPSAKICGIPVIWSEYSDLTKHSIDQILSDEENIYVLYGENEGILQVFDTQGVYQYSASFYDHLNGAFSLALREGTLYVRDSVHNVYIFHDGKFDNFLERDEASSLLDNLNFSMESENYQIRFGSIWYVSDMQEYCVVQRPVRTVFYQNNLYFLIAIVFVLLLGLVRKKSCSLLLV